MTTKIIEYTDCYMVEVNDKQFVFDGLDEPDKLANVLKELYLHFEYEEIARDIIKKGGRYE